MKLEGCSMMAYLGKFAYMVDPFVLVRIGPLKHGVSISKVEVYLNTLRSFSSSTLACGVSRPTPTLFYNTTLLP